MHLVYLDESVDDQYFVLAAVLVQEANWLKNLNTLVGMRGALRRKYGIPARAELKAQTHFRRGEGPVAALGWTTDRRGEAFCLLMQWQALKLDTQVMAVAINKAKLYQGKDPRYFAWKYTLERIDTFCRKNGSKAILFPDSGHSYFIRKLLRHMRRFERIPGRFGGTLQVPCERIVEDPNERLSHESYFIQLADWCAFAALRSPYVAPRVASFAGAWDALGGSRVEGVEYLTATPPHIPGLKIFPK